MFSTNASVTSYAFLLALLIVLLLLIWLDNDQELKYDISSPQSNTVRLVCYYNFNNTNLVPELIDASLCSHINVAFAGIYETNHSIALSSLQLQLLSRVMAVTSRQNCKTLLSVGGAGGTGFSAMVSNHTSRKLFIRSLMKVIKNNKMDGVDLDWEWPVIDGGSKEKVQFVQLLHEIRVEFDRHKKKYDLSVAVAAVESIVASSYYVQHIAENVDFVNIMSYDYHFFNKLYPVTDFNSPLYCDPKDKKGALANFNVNYTLHLWLSLGMPRENIVLGLPAYGHTYRLRNSANRGRLAPAEGFGFGEDGFALYQEICTFLQSSPFVTVKRDSSAKVPYAFDFINWVSYDDETSLTEKVELAKRNKVSGVMFYSLNSDDYDGECSGNIKYPLLRAVHQALYN